MCTVDLNVDNISDKTHIKMTFSSSICTGKQFYGNALCRSDHFVTQLIHIFTINTVFYKPPEKSRAVKSEEGEGQRMDLLLHPTIRKLPVRESTNTTGEESRGWEFFSSPPRPEQFWSPPSFLSNGY
jgi:hypothetical protein